MAENEQEKPQTAPDAQHAQEGDHALVAEETVVREPSATLAEPSEPPLEAAEPDAPPRKRRGYGQRFALLAALLGLLATSAGVLVVKFKDSDERLRAISDQIDQATRDPNAFIATQTQKLAEWSGSAAPRQSAKPARLPEAPPPHTAAVEAAPPPVASPPPAKAEPGPETAALAKKIERLEAIAAEALDTAREAQRLGSRPADDKPAAARVESEDLSVIYALEGRVEALSDQLRELRDRLDEPKGETRAAREPVEVAPAAPPAAEQSLTALETLALAQSLQRALEQGRPFAAQHAALSERGADSQLLAVLAPFAERGAPTTGQLLATFTPIGKRLRALDTAPGAAPGASLTDRLLHDAGKLMRVRPVNEAPTDSIEEITARIETALAHDDLSAAAQAFAKLPENAKSEAKSFGEDLERRREAEQAATSLLESAVAGLGHVRN